LTPSFVLVERRSWAQAHCPHWAALVLRVALVLLAGPGLAEQGRLGQVPPEQGLLVPLALLERLVLAEH